jgi:hypothetical protein
MTGRPRASRRIIGQTSPAILMGMPLMARDSIIEEDLRRIKDMVRSSN